MALFCWTVVHELPAAIVRHVARPVRHVTAATAKRVGHASHHVGHPIRPHHVAHVIRKAAHPRRWIETVCRMVPGAMLGGGLLLAPPPATRLAPIPPVMQALAPSW